MKIWSEGIRHYSTCPGWYQTIYWECGCQFEKDNEMSTDEQRMGRKEVRAVNQYLGEDEKSEKGFQFERARDRHGSPLFYSLLSEMADTHDNKSHDYASNNNPFGNYHFAGRLALLFIHSEHDAGFAGRIGEKIYRLANLERDGKTPRNESIEDTERDIAVITTLWMADRRQRRWDKQSGGANQYLAGGSAGGGKTDAMVEQAKAAKSEAAASQIIELIQSLVPEHTKQMRDYLSAVLSQAEAMALATKVMETGGLSGHTAGLSPQRKS